MELKEGMIVNNKAGAYWCQYLSQGDINGCIIFDGRAEGAGQTYAQLEDLEPTELPVGLASLGFTEINYEPGTKIYRRNPDMEISVREANQYYIGDKKITFTYEVQEAFGLFDLIDSRRRI